MRTTIEVTHSAIRLCRVADNRITSLERWPVPAGADPFSALAAVPLPSDLGRVRVLIHHEDMLIRGQTVPPGPPERVDRLVRFDADAAMSADAETVAMAWHSVDGLGGAELPVLVQLTKQGLIEKVRQALVPHQARLDGLGHVCGGLFEAFRAQGGDETAILLDCGGKHIHIALTHGGTLVFQRTTGPGLDDLVERLAAKRGLSREDGQRLLERLGKGSPDDLHELINQAGRTIAAQVTACQRFAIQQLKLDSFVPVVMHLTGAGAQVHGLAAALKQHSGLPVRFLNPFAGRPLALPTAEADRLAGLPGEWAVVMGGASAERLMLDALGDERQADRQRFRTVGILRIATAVAAVLMISALALVESSITRNWSVLKELRDRHPVATTAAKDASAARLAKAAAAERLAWLDGERRVGRIVPEILAAISGIQDPQTCPIRLEALRATRRPGQTMIDIEGAATAAGKAGTDRVLHEFEQGLKESYPAIATMEALPKPIAADRHPFHYRIAIPDRP